MPSSARSASSLAAPVSGVGARRVGCCYLGVWRRFADRTAHAEAAYEHEALQPRADVSYCGSQVDGALSVDTEEVVSMQALGCAGRMDDIVGHDRRKFCRAGRPHRQDSGSTKRIRPSRRYLLELPLRTAAHVSKPRLSASSTIKLPMKPLAPVTNIFFMPFGTSIKRAQS